jgi:polyphosphate kinase
VASGNYNPTTSCFYTDVGMFTCDDAVGEDATEMFNYLTGSSRQMKYRKLLVAPVNLKEKTVELIDREIRHRQEGRPAHIVAKLNRLADKEIIEKLYEASKAGVKIDLIVRGVCMLRPGVEGLSENITVRNIIGRFLEHSRVFYFANGGEEEVYIGSADWMARNLKYRIEVVAPVTNPALQHYLKHVLLAAYLRDNVKARELNPDGSYVKVSMELGEKPFDSQRFFMNHETALA